MTDKKNRTQEQIRADYLVELKRVYGNKSIDFLEGMIEAFGICHNVVIEADCRLHIMSVCRGNIEAFEIMISHKQLIIEGRN